MIYFLLSKRWIFRGQSVTLALFYGISGYLSAHEKLRAELNCPSGMWINHILHFKLNWARNEKIPLQLSKPKDQFQGDKKPQVISIPYSRIWAFCSRQAPTNSQLSPGNLHRHNIFFGKAVPLPKIKTLGMKSYQMQQLSLPQGQLVKEIKLRVATSPPQMRWLMEKTNISLQTQKSRILLLLF